LQRAQHARNHPPAEKRTDGSVGAMVAAPHARSLPNLLAALFLAQVACRSTEPASRAVAGTAGASAATSVPARERLSAPIQKSSPGAKNEIAARCSADTDCPEEGRCEGQGCGPMQGHCVSGSRICTTDLAAYCGCDGQEFQSSGSCPRARYAYRGRCKPPQAAGAPCSAGEQCLSGFCVGDALEACTRDPLGTCTSDPPMCTRDLRSYCGCDGAPFRASGSCPNRSFRRRGPC